MHAELARNQAHGSVQVGSLLLLRVLHDVGGRVRGKTVLIHPLQVQYVPIQMDHGEPTAEVSSLLDPGKIRSFEDDFETRSTLVQSV